MNDAKPLLTAKGIRKFYGRWKRKYLFFGPRVDPPIRALTDIDFTVASGRTLGIVGESGSGKTTAARVVVGLISRNRGDLQLHGEKLGNEVGDRTPKQIAAIRMVFQNPTASLNPKLPISHSILRPLRKLGELDRRSSYQRAIKLLQDVGIEPDYLERYPSELSGGQQQRVTLASAFAANPDLIVADEAVSALDVSVQAQVLNLLEKHQRDTETSYIFISHDLSVVRYISDDIMVLYAGHVVEYGPVLAVLNIPSHPYTEALLSAVPFPDPDAQPTRIRLPGTVPTLRRRIQGCFFAGRCPRKLGSICDEVLPPTRIGIYSENHIIYCHIPIVELQKIQQI
jgi:peptide/nickel transport system ATP-binding protein